MPEYTGPQSIPPEKMQRWRHRMLDVMRMVAMRNMALVCHPDDLPFMKDQMDWAMDPDQADDWQYPGTPDVYTLASLTPGQVFAWDPASHQVLTFGDLVRGNTGFGRYGGILLPGKGGELSNPWRLPPKRGGG